MTVYRPCRDYVLVELEEHPSVSPGGILLLPPKEDPRQLIGTVLAVGPGTRDERGRLIRTSVKVGERIAFSRHYIGRRMENLVIFREPSVHYVCDP